MSEPIRSGDHQGKPEYGSAEIASDAARLMNRFKEAFSGTPQFTSAVAKMWLAGVKDDKVEFETATGIFRILSSKFTPGNEELVLRVDSNGESEKVLLHAKKNPGTSTIEYGKRSLGSEIYDQSVLNNRTAVQEVEEVLGKLGGRLLPSTSRETSRPKPPQEGKTNSPIVGPLGPMPLPGGRSPWSGI